MQVASSASHNRSPVAGERGVTLMEALVAMLLAGLIGGAMVANLQFSLRMSKYTEIHHAASAIALNRMEQMAAVDVLDLTAASFNESQVTTPWASLNGITFRRSTTITVNADTSRTAVVTVDVLGYDLPVTVTYQNRYTIW